MTTRSRPFTVRRGLVLATSLTLAGGAVSAATFAADPPGNNGTVMVTPHNACDIDITWRGFDKAAGLESTITFTPQAPTDSVGIGSYDRTVALQEGGAEKGYTLRLTGDPHPVQGYHLKVTVQTPGSLGNDTKSKVIWVAPCGGDGGGDGGGDTGGGPILF